MGASHARRRCYCGGPSAPGVGLVRCEAALSARPTLYSLPTTPVMHTHAHDSTCRAGDQHRREHAVRSRREAQVGILSDEWRRSCAESIDMIDLLLRARREVACEANPSLRRDGCSKSTRGVRA